MGSPPKPWERSGAAVTAAAASAPSLSSSSTAAPAPSSSSTVPTVPERPASFTGPTTNAPITSTATSTALNSSTPYSYGASPYSRLGAGYSSYGGGLGNTYGGYGSSYGGLGSYGGMGYSGLGYGGYGGYSGYGMNGMGMGMGMGYGGMGMGMGGLYGQPPLDANGNPIPTLTQTFEATTQHTFTLLHSIVQTFGGLAQMLESTFMATHSSFFAMVGVVDQFSQLRNALGSVLGLFGLVRWMREALTGTRTGPGGGMQNEFRQFVSGGGRPVQGGPPGAPGAPRGSKKPLIFFLLAMFGIPYAMSKLIKILAARAQAQGQGALLPNGQPLLNANGQPLPPGLDLNGQQGQLPPLDPSQLTFARALYPFSASNSSELSLKEDEIVAIMGKWDNRRGVEVDPRIELEVSGDKATGEAEWWKGRTRDGREGWFPKKWVEVLKKKEVKALE